MNDLLTALGVVAAGYLLGAIPTGYLIGRLHGLDIRRVGDGNVGMMNVYRSVGPAWGVLCFAVDLGKAMAAVGLARLADAGQGAAMAAGVAALVGHRYPVTLGFRGGRSAASAVGVMLATVPAEGWGPTALGLAIVLATRNAILGLAIGFATLLAVLIWRGVDPGVIVYSLSLPVYAAVNDALDRRRRRAADAQERPA